MSGLRVRLYTLDGREVEPLDALATAIDLRAELAETSARRTSGWLFNQPPAPEPPDPTQPAEAPLTRLSGSFIP